MLSSLFGYGSLIFSSQITKLQIFVTVFMHLNKFLIARYFPESEELSTETLGPSSSQFPKILETLTDKKGYIAPLSYHISSKEIDKFFNLEKLHIAPWMVLFFFISKFNSLFVLFYAIFFPLHLLI